MWAWPQHQISVNVISQRVGRGSFATHYITFESLHPQGLEGSEQKDFVEIAFEAYAVVSHLYLLRASQEREVRAAACLPPIACKWRCVLVWPWPGGCGGVGVWAALALKEEAAEFGWAFSPRIKVQDTDVGYGRAAWDSSHPAQEPTTLLGLEM